MKKIEENPKGFKVYLRVCKPTTINLSGREFVHEFLDYIPSDVQLKREPEIKVFDNFVFEATLTPYSWYRGRSASGFIMRANDYSMPMRLTEVFNLNKALVEGKVKLTKDGFNGRYTFDKKGSAISIKLYEEVRN